jgi:hypothetical protein
MTNDAVKSVAAQVPMSVEELTAIGVLGENVIKVYGERLIESIQNFVKSEALEDFVQKRRPAKRTKTAPLANASEVARAVDKPNVVVEIVSDDDEFDSGIDFGAIDFSDVKQSSNAIKGGSRYFR